MRLGAWYILPKILDASKGPTDRDVVELILQYFAHTSARPLDTSYQSLKRPSSEYHISMLRWLDACYPDILNCRIEDVSKHMFKDSVSGILGAVRLREGI